MDASRAGAHHAGSAPPDQNAPSSARDLWREARKLLSGARGGAPRTASRPDCMREGRPWAGETGPRGPERPHPRPPATAACCTRATDRPDLEERLLERRFDKEALEREVKARKTDLQAVVDGAARARARVHAHAKAWHGLHQPHAGPCGCL
jgi:hypothetical protein